MSELDNEDVLGHTASTDFSQNSRKELSIVVEIIRHQKLELEAIPYLMGFLTSNILFSQENFFLEFLVEDLN